MLGGSLSTSGQFCDDLICMCLGNPDLSELALLFFLCPHTTQRRWCTSNFPVRDDHQGALLLRTLRLGTSWDGPSCCLLSSSQVMLPAHGPPWEQGQSSPTTRRLLPFLLPSPAPCDSVPLSRHPPALPVPRRDPRLVMLEGESFKKILLKDNLLKQKP